MPRVGGKNASLGEMFRELADKEVKVPNGFAITAQAYRDFFHEAKLDRKIKKILYGLNCRY
ncbi:PEP/pyruvate-binding domain-containing protein [Candidatus Nitrospira salsa]